jgi:hypothetical protein
MGETSGIMTIIGSGLLAAVVSSAVSRLNAERNILIDNITKERKSWRETIRKKSTKVFRAFYSADKLELKKLKSEFQLMLNPSDEDDNDILTNFDTLIGKCDEKDEVAINNFIIRLSLLLKHDWERAKIEANPLDNIGRTAVRVSFEEHQKNQVESNKGTEQ